MSICHRQVRWPERYLELQESASTPEIHRIWIARSATKKSCPVFIEGKGFKPWMMLAAAEVDGIPLQNLTILNQGTRIQGTLPSAAPGDAAHVNLGYASASWRRTP